MMEGALVLGYLLDQYRFSLPEPKAEIGYEPAVIMLVRGGLNLHVEKLQRRASALTL